jgi:hypothetical protein
MTFVLPRLDRASALELLEQLRFSPLAEIAAAMPETNAVVTFSPVGGQRADPAELVELRNGLLVIAREHGMPTPIVSVSAWEAKSARLLHERLTMTANEASHDEVWSYMTCCWLLDIAIWRFGADSSLDRFVGHLNRNTFRRMWWRAEVFGPEVDLAQLGEDELVNIMERPTLFSDRRLARAIALEHIERARLGITVERMRLMREATKRLLRLTPFMAFQALDDQQVRLVVADAFDVAAAGLAGTSMMMPHRTSDDVPSASSEIRDISELEIAEPTDEGPESLEEGVLAVNFDDVARAAVALARRTGRVTNTSLREVVPSITPEEARDVFRHLIDGGQLVRRGVKRGTHYVVPDEDTTAPTVPAPEPQPEDGASATTPRRPTSWPPVSRPPQRPSDTALRRLLRRMR